MDLRVLLLSSLLLTTAALAVAPSASAACIVTVYGDLDCEARVGGCDLEAGQTMGKTHTSSASADCRMGNMTRCYFGVGFVGSVTDPKVERWCAV